MAGLQLHESMYSVPVLLEPKRVPSKGISMSVKNNTMKKTSLRKGIILAGGHGTRLFPITRSVNKHLLPVYDKPLIYYPLTTLMLAGVKEILIISNPGDIPMLRSSLGDGRQWGLDISYLPQQKPGGIAEGILIAEDFIAGDPFTMILGDNIFYGRDFSSILTSAADHTSSHSVIFTVWVDNPQAYGVLQTNAAGEPVSIEEKPQNPASHQAVTGLYFYDNRAVELTRTLKPSARGELEITDLNRLYLEDGTLVSLHLGRGFIWFDAGTTHNLLRASELVQIMQSRQRTGIAYPEEVAYRKGLVDFGTFRDLVKAMPGSAYQDYLKGLVSDIQEGHA